MWLLTAGFFCFCGRPIERRHFLLQGSNGGCGQNKQKITQNGHSFSCMRHIRAEFGYEIGFQLSANSSVTIPYTTKKGVTMATNFGTIIAIDAFLWERYQERDYLWQGVFVVGQSKEYIFDCKGLMDVAMTTKIWTKWPKITQCSNIGVNFSNKLYSAIVTSHTQSLYKLETANMDAVIIG